MKPFEVVLETALERQEENLQEDFRRQLIEWEGIVEATSLLDEGLVREDALVQLWVKLVQGFRKSREIYRSCLCRTLPGCLTTCGSPEVRMTLGRYFEQT